MAELDIKSPYSGEVVGAVPDLAVDQVDAAVQTARTYGFGLSGYQRYEILDRAADGVAKDREAFEQLIINEIGVSYKDAHHEVERTVNVVRLAAEEAKRVEGELPPPEVSPGFEGRLVISLREPVGLVGCITPFNHPLNQVAHKICPALAANNAVVLKPSVKSPLSALKFAQLLHRCGLPENMLQVLTGKDRVVGQALVEHPDVDMINFTGSVAVGDIIARSAGIKKLALELSGNDVFVVAPDADVEAAAKVAVAGAFGNSGQRCSSIKRIAVFPNNADAFAKALADLASKLVVGNPYDHGTDIGTVVDEPAARDIERRLNLAQEDGAEILTGGKRDGAQIWPTVLDKVNPDSELVKEETFGPIAPIIRVETMEQAIALVNDSPFALNAAIFTNNLNDAMAFARKVKTGGVRINQAPSYRNEMLPFGGNKKSGYGRAGVHNAIKEMTNLKTVVL
jgi:putative phosphonoacetaldehyde dehydrogenase